MSPDIWHDLFERLSTLQNDMTECREAQARMDAKLTSIIGNGQPGRLSLLETTVAKHSAALNRLKGAGAVLTGLLGGVFAYFHYWH